MYMEPTKCVVLLSGGIDSAACVAFYIRQQFAVQALHVSYGQPAARQEEASAKAVASHYRIPLAIVKLDGIRMKADGEIIGRNAFLISTAVMEAPFEQGIVALGIHSGTSYYDCTPGFLVALQALYDGQCDGRLRVSAPFLDWTKQDIWQYCLEQQIPIEVTYSCEKGLAQPCGVCLSCGDREALHAH